MDKLTNFQKTGERTAFFGQQDHFDTVVFIHGFGGHNIKSWGKFPELLSSDPDLPKLDIFLWGYRTGGLIRPLVNDIETIGDQLISDLTQRMRPDNALHLVGHSLGGLIILKGIVSEMVCSRAQDPPVSSISFISLFAVPVSGSGVLGMVKHMLGKLWFVGSLINKQIRSLSSKSYIDSLYRDVCTRIDKPSNQGSGARTIPIRMIMGNRDMAVDASDRRRASARFQSTTPLSYDFNHSNIKEPTDHHDERYQALSRDIQDGLGHRFQEICIDLKQNLSDNTYKNAVMEFKRRYEHIFRRRLEDQGVDIEKDQELYGSFLRAIISDCSRNPNPPFYAADRILTVLREAGKL